MKCKTVLCLMALQMTENIQNLEPMTGAKRRNALLSRLFDALQASQPLHLLGLDIQGMLALNDLYGMQDADRILRAVSACLGERFGQDQVYRIGGDELVVLLESSDYPRIPAFWFAPERHQVRLALAGAAIEPDEISVRLRHCLVTLLPEFGQPSRSARKHHTFLWLMAGFALLLVEQTLLDAGVEGWQRTFHLNEDSLLPPE